MTTEELSTLITIFVSVGLLTFFISTLIEQYHHRKYKRIQMKDEESIHFLLNYTNIKLGLYYTNNNLESLIEIVSIKILHDDNHGGYYIKLNDSHIVDKNTVISIYYNGYYYQNE